MHSPMTLTSLKILMETVLVIMLMHSPRMHLRQQTQMAMGLVIMLMFSQMILPKPLIPMVIPLETMGITALR